MTPPWPSMATFLKQQQQQRSVPSSSTNTPPSPSDAEDYEYSISILNSTGDQIEAAQSLSIPQRIATEHAAWDNLLNHIFKTTSGHPSRLTTNLPLPSPLVTRAGCVVPGSYMRLSRVDFSDSEGELLHAVHLYAHEYKDLTHVDMLRYCSVAAKALLAEEGLGRGAFGIVSFGTGMAFLEVTPDGRVDCCRTRDDGTPSWEEKMARCG